MIGFRAETRIGPVLSDWLDLARGLAAVEVLAFHSYQLMFMERLPDESHGPAVRMIFAALWTVSAHGPAAVLVFFVLSGYLVGGPALVRSLRGRLNAIDYLSARLSRLYVVLLPALAVSFCLCFAARQFPGWQIYVSSHQDVYNSAVIFHAPIGVAAAVCNALFLQTIACSEFAGNAALWSLSNEFWYYVLFFALISLRKSPAFAALIIGVLGLFMLAEHFDGRGTHAGLKLLFFFVIWCLGVIAYAVIAPAWVWCCSIIASIGALYMLASIGLLPQWAAFSMAVGLGTTAFIVGIDQLKVPMPSVLRAGRELAKLSFSLYAIHYPILLFLNTVVASDRRDFTLGSVALEGSFMLGCLLAAGLFYLSFERHTPAIRDWLKGVMRRVQAGEFRLVRLGVILDAVDGRYAFAPRLGAFGPAGESGITSSPSRIGASLQHVAGLRAEQSQTDQTEANVPMVLLNDGHALPQIGFGAWQIDDAAAPDVVGTAIKSGYRLIDTAANYGNEAGVGLALQRADLPRSQFYVTTKLRNEDHGYDRTMRAFEASAARLQLDVIDLYLIHWPCPQRAAYVETWRVLIELQKQGRVRSIGVSNFAADHLSRIIQETGVAPAVSQIELHPAFQQVALRKLHEHHGIATQAWSPLGQGRALEDPRILALAERCGCSAAQIILRWHIENGIIAIPKSADASRMAANIDLFRFNLTADALDVMSGLDDPAGRIGPDPATYGRMRFASRLMRGALKGVRRAARNPA